MAFRHFSHPHPLKLNKEIHDDDLKSPAECIACRELCVGPTYSCDECCNFFLDKSCAELAQEFQSPYHLHPLILTVVNPKGRKKFKCDACGRKHRGGLAFCCKECDLNLDVRCALLRLTIDEGQDQLHHFSHFHPLVIEKKHIGYCMICGKRSSGAFYGCKSCCYYIHQSCSQLPHKLQYFAHPCLLTLCLVDKSHYCCNACDGWVRGHYYGCKPCDFKMDIICALLVHKMESEGLQLFHHFFHGHPLTLREIKHDDNNKINCSACQKSCSGQTYECCSSKCKFYLHQSCFNLPQKIYHPFHPRHHLTLTKPTRGLECSFCFNDCVGFTYGCHETHDCSFHLDVGCLAEISIIKYQGHHHNLFFISSTRSLKRFSCHACGSNSRIFSPIFRCFKCDIFLHFECGPLPCKIRHDNHIYEHTLELIDSPVVIEHEDKEDTNQFICDVCEKLDRNPCLPVYYCSEGCTYLAELNCVISEVILSLLGESGEVELKTPIRHVPGKVIRRVMAKGVDLREAGQDSETGENDMTPTLTFNEIFHSLLKEEEEKEELLSVIVSARKDCDKDSSEVARLISTKVRTRFKKLLNRKAEEFLIPLPVGKMKHDGKYYEYLGLWEKEMAVSVGDHSVRWGLAPILEDLCAKYGDITAASAFRSSKVKTYFIAILCVTIHTMYATRVFDISKHHLANWWVNLKILQSAGFRVQFAFERLKRVMHAYNGLQIKDIAKKKHEKLHGEISKVSQTIKKLKAELAEQTTKLEALKERSNGVEAEPEFSSFQAECLKQASVLKWKVAGEGLL